MKIIRFLFLLAVMGVHSVCLAQFCATGSIEGNVCKGFVFESCSLKKITAVKEGDQIYEIKRCYSDVTEYDKSKQRCIIKVGSSMLGVIAWGIDASTLPIFLYKNKEGAFVEVEPDYLTFPCEHKEF